MRRGIVGGRRIGIVGGRSISVGRIMGGRRSMVVGRLIVWGRRVISRVLVFDMWVIP